MFITKYKGGQVQKSVLCGVSETPEIFFARSKIISGSNGQMVGEYRLSSLLMSPLAR
jgi:hypothetical protein